MDNNILELKEHLKNGIVEFSFIKKDGTTRSAKGTTNIGIISEVGGTLPIGADYKISDNVTKYYDIESQGWRSFINENFVSFNS